MAKKAQALKLKFPEPFPKQVQFLKARHKYVAFGGARGGGKSWAVRMKAILLCLRYPGIMILIIRRSYPELRKNHITPLRKIIPKNVAKYNNTDKEFRFINGSLIQFQYLKSDKDIDNLQGTEADVIFIDEATHHLEHVFKEVCACLRGVNEFPKRVYLTCNPGGPGHGWMKRLFVERHYNEDEDPNEYTFIQSTVDDNLALMKYQPDYVKQLDALPPKLKKAWRYGDWDIFEGQFFEEFADKPQHYAFNDRRWTHVIDEFDPPLSWPRFRSFDWGYAKPFSCGWWTMDPEGRLYRILELYGCRPKEPNEGVKWDKDLVFSKIHELETTHPYLMGHTIRGVADPSIWKEDGGVSIAETAAAHGVYFGKGDNTRIPGWMQVHYRLAFDDGGRPMMYAFKTCKDFIRTMPLQVYSETIPEDLDTKGEDHIPDEVRYLCMMHPIPPRTRTEVFKPTEDDPLNLIADADKMTHARYEFFLK